MNFRTLITITFLTIATVLAGCQRSFTDAEYLAHAQELVDKGDSSAAVIELKNALTENPDNSDARALLGQLYLDAGDLLGAEKELTRAVEYPPVAAATRLNLIQTYLELHRYEDVAQKLDVDSFTETDNRSRAYNLLAGAYAGLGFLGDAQQWYADSLAIQDTATARAGLIGLAVRENRLNDASTLIDESLSLHPGNFDLSLAAAQYELTKQNFDGALQYLSDALEIKEDTRAYLVKAELLLAQGKTDEAETAVNRVFDMDSSNLMAQFISGKIAYRRKDMEGTKSILERLVSVAPNHAPTLLLLGTIYAQENHNERALQLLQLHARLAPESRPGRELLAKVYWSEEQYDDAAKTVLPLLAEEPENIRLLELASSALVRQGKLKQAGAYFEKLAELQPNSVMAQYYLGATLYANGDIKGGIATLEDVVEADAGQVDARMILMKSYLDTGQYAEAEALANNILDSDPNLTIGWNYLGLIYQQQGKIDSATEFYEKALEIEPNNPEANGQLATIARNGGKLDQAQAFYDKIYEKNPTHFTTRVANAALFAQKQDVVGAIEQLEIAAESNPTDLRANLLLATYYLRYGQYENSLRVSSALHRAHPGNASTLPLISEAMLKLNMWSSALEVLSAWDAAQPRSPEIYARKAYAYMLAQKLGTAQSMVDTALEIDKDHLRTQLEQVRLLMIKQDFSAADQLLAKLQKKFPNNYRVLKRSGDLAFASGQFDKAAAVFQESNSLSAQSETTAALGKALWKAGKGTQMQTTLHSWLEVYPNDRAIRFQLAQGYLLMNNRSGAISELEILLESNPEDTKILNFLAWQLKDDNIGTAKTYAEKAYALAPRHPQIIDTLGTIALMDGQSERSVGLFREALEISPGNTEIQLHLAKALLANNEKKDALATLNRLVEPGPGSAHYKEASELLAKLKN